MNPTADLKYSSQKALKMTQASQSWTPIIFKKKKKKNSFFRGLIFVSFE